MAKREPLPGWAPWLTSYRGWSHWVDVGPYCLEAGPTGWRITENDQPDCFGVTTTNTRDAQLAAEDGARALAADIVAALGGSVTWPEGEAPDA